MFSWRNSNVHSFLFALTYSLGLMKEQEVSYGFCSWDQFPCQENAFI